MDKFVTRAPTWKTMTLSTLTTASKTGRASLCGNKSSKLPNNSRKPLKENNNNLNINQDRRLSLRDEKLMHLLSFPPDEPLLPCVTDSNSSCNEVAYFRCLTPTNGNDINQNLPPATTTQQSQPSSKVSDYMNCSETLSDKIAISEVSENSNVPYEKLLYDDGNIPPKSPIKKQQNIVLDRIQSDLNSPSASVRLRAMKALKSSKNYAAYTVFDVPHAEQSIITAEERLPPPALPTIEELMQEVVVYVEVRTGEDNRSDGVKKVISALGARVNDKLLRDTTHVIFKDGLLSTYKKAKNWNIPIVSILWIEACKNERRICDPNNYQISNIDRYENPELYEKLKRHKSMQPDSETKKRVRVKPSTPSNATPTSTRAGTPRSTTITTKKTPKPINTSPASNTKTDITKYFEPLAKKTNKPQNNVTNTMSETPTQLDSPATRLLNRINARGEIAATPTITLNESRVGEQLATTATNSTALTPSRTVRTRRSSLNTLANMSISATPKSARKHTTRHEIASIREEESIFEKPDNAGINTKTRRQTNNTPASLTMSHVEADTPINTAAKHKQLNRRRTLFTPQPMELTTQQQLENDTINEMTSFFDLSNNIGSSTQITVANTSSTITPEINKTLLDVQAETLVFSSTREPRSRRTLFDVGMDIITQRMQNINRSARRSLAITTSDVSLDMRRKSLETDHNSSNNVIKSATTPNLPSQLPINNDDNTPNGVKKRKLFMPLDDSLTPLTPIATASLKDSATAETSKTNTKRRRTLVSAKSETKTTKPKNPTRIARRSTLLFDLSSTNKSSEASAILPKDNDPNSKATTKELKSKTTNGIDNFSANDIGDNNNLKTLVYTNMHTDQITVIREALTKLGGFRLEYNITDSTTHLISLEPRRTLNMLRALVRGLWILNYRWIEDSMRKGKWVSEELYEMENFSRAVSICRAERQAFGSTYRCELFVNLGLFYVSSHCGPVSKDNLKELITSCGGKAIENRKRAKYVIADRNKTVDDKIYVTPYWILDSITQMQLLHYQKYSIPSELQRARLPFQPYQSHSKVLKALQVTHTDFQRMAAQVQTKK